MNEIKRPTAQDSPEVMVNQILMSVCLHPCSEQLMQLYCARQRRRLNRGLRRKQHSLLKRLRKAKKEAPPMEKPEVVKTHLRDMVILPEMVGSMVGVYNGKTFNQVEIKVRWCWTGGVV